MSHRTLLEISFRFTWWWSRIWSGFNPEDDRWYVPTSSERCYNPESQHWHISFGWSYNGTLMKKSLERKLWNYFCCWQLSELCFLENPSFIWRTVKTASEGAVPETVFMRVPKIKCFNIYVIPNVVSVISHQLCLFISPWWCCSCIAHRALLLRSYFTLRILHITN
jgi:hypothetical protein